jgi:hypothetical protein
VHLKTDEMAPGEVNHNFSLTVIGVPSGVQLSTEEVEQIRLDEMQIPLADRARLRVIEHEPEPVDDNDDPELPPVA